MATIDARGFVDDGLPHLSIAGNIHVKGDVFVNDQPVGLSGSVGASGSQGPPGTGYTHTTGSFLMPVVGGSVTVGVVDTLVAVLQQPIGVQTAGSFLCTAKDAGTIAQLKAKSFYEAITVKVISLGQHDFQVALAEQARNTARQEVADAQAAFNECAMELAKKQDIDLTTHTFNVERWEFEKLT